MGIFGIDALFATCRFQERILSSGSLSLKGTVQRDANKVAELEQAGWKVLIFWEHEVKKDAMQCALRIKENIDALDHATSH